MDEYWNCEICGRARRDDQIGLITYPLKIAPTAERNLKFCKDNSECVEKANERAKSGAV